VKLHRWTQGRQERASGLPQLWFAPLEGDLGESHAGDLRRESAEVRAERIIAEELRRQGWRGADLAERRKSDPVKLALAARLRRQTTPCLPAGR